MTTAPLSVTPRLRADIRLGRALRRRGDIVHYLKDPRAAEYFRVGAKEFFLIERLDGRRTLAEIGDEYARAFDRRLADAHWRRLLDLLGGRGLLTVAGAGGQPVVSADGPPPRPRSRRSLLRRTFPLLNPDAKLGVLAPRLDALFHPVFPVVALLAVVATAAFVITHMAEFTHDLASARERTGSVLPVVLAVNWLIIGLHETAHGVVCKRFGGTVPELGIIWRFPMLAPYCRVDDVILFRRRRHAVYTALAGVFAGLLTLPPLAVVWWIAEPGGAARGIAASLLFVVSLAAGFNLLPFLQMDGYLALNHALGMDDLRLESYRFWRLVLTRRWEPLRRYPPRDRWIYAAYGLASFLVATALVGLALWWLLG